MSYQIIIIINYLISPANYKELFSLCHSQAQNVIEHIFGVAKRRFKMLRESSELPIRTQTQIVCAMAVLHNFIVFHDPSDLLDWEPNVEDEENDIEGTRATGISRAEVACSNLRRDKIAQDMWADYQKTLRVRKQKSTV